MRMGGIASLTDAMAVEDKAAEWVADRHNPEGWTVERQGELDAWLAQSLSHRVAYLRMEAAWRRTNRLAALRPSIRTPPRPNSSKNALVMCIAGALSVVVLVGALAGNYLRSPQGQLIETPKGGQEKLALADGSQIELNTDSAIRLDIGSVYRSVELIRGEAFFEVKHDAVRPFVVTVAGHTITDLSTKFLVRATPDSLRVALLEGRARLEGISGISQQHAVVLSTGDVAVATVEATRVLKKSNRELSDSLAWQHGLIVFHNTPLVDAVAEFNRYGGAELVVADRGAAKLTINGTFRFTSAENFAASAHEIFDLKVDHKNGSIILSR
jgi:transmembrane sensor